jgi:hypothetical protein
VEEGGGTAHGKIQGLEKPRLFCNHVNFRVPAEFEIAIGIGIEIGSGNVRLTPIFDSDFDPDPDFGPQLS